MFEMNMRLVGFRSLEPISEIGLVSGESMSLSERLKSCRTPDPLPGLSRSRSFAGLLGSNQHRRTPSTTALGSGSSDAGSVSSLGSSGSGEPHQHYNRSCSGSLTGGSLSASSTLSRGNTVLGQSHSPNTTRRMLQGFSATWGGKPPPAPRPQRAVTMFQAIERGLRECIQLAQKDIANLKSSVDSLSVNSSQQLKTAERYLKRLECQAAKLDELNEQYDVQHRMRDGVRTMAYAYVLNPGKERDSALQNVRSGYKECTDVLCGIEAELERMMGTLEFQLKGIQGFARLCAGDVFEITIKYGEQKWRTRGRILKNEKQIWDNPGALFKALMGEMLYIKAVEVRTLSKNVLLGHKYCETKDLFSAHPQMMTVNLNPSGSLKLHVVIIWNPLHGCQEDLSPKPLPPLLAVLQSPMMKRRAPLPSNCILTDQQDLPSPTGSDSLPNGRSMVCIPPLVPSSTPPNPSAPQETPAAPPTLVLTEANQEESVCVLNFTEENENYSCSSKYSDSSSKSCKYKCCETRELDKLSDLDLVEKDLQNCMLESYVYKEPKKDYKNPGEAEYRIGDVHDLHVDFNKVHDDQSLYETRGSYQSSGYASQSRNGSTWRSVHLNYTPDSDQNSYISARSKDMHNTPMLYNFMENSESNYQMKGVTRSSDDIFNSRQGKCLEKGLVSKLDFSDVGIDADYTVPPSCTMIELRKLDTLLNANAAQRRLACYFEYR